MRGRRTPQVSMMAFVNLEERVPSDHPLRTIKALADEALAALSDDLDRMYAQAGRPSIPPERLLKASLLIALWAVSGPFEKSWTTTSCFAGFWTCG